MFVIYILPLVIVDFITDLGFRALMAVHADLPSLESSGTDVATIEQAAGGFLRPLSRFLPPPRSRSRFPTPAAARSPA